MSHNNKGNQSGDGSLNIGVGDFRGANLHVGNAEVQNNFILEKLDIVRHPAFGGRKIKSKRLEVFGIVTGIASLIGLYFTLFQGFTEAKPSSWFTLFLFGFMVAVISFVISKVLKRRKFENFISRKHYLEAGTNGGIYINKFTAVCPWCGSKMNLRNIGPKNGPYDDIFICERNPKQHQILLDPTVLPDIVE